VSIVKEFLKNPYARMTERTCRYLCRVAKNSRGKFSDTTTIAVSSALSMAQPVFEDAYFEAVKARIVDMLFKKNGERRKTQQSLRFSDAQAQCIRDSLYARAVGFEVHYPAYNHSNGNRSYAGAYMLWSFVTKQGSVTAFYVPWQSNTNHEYTGVFLHQA
jgi:hypothetical protein